MNKPTPPLTAGQKYRRRRRKRLLAEKPTKNHAICRICLCKKPLSHFVGTMKPRVVSCKGCRLRQRSYSNRKAKSLYHRFYRFTHGEQHRGYVKAYHGKRPGLHMLYKLRWIVDAAWKTGDPVVQKYLTARGYRPSDSCHRCGSQENLVAYWCDLRNPARFIRLCASDRKLQAQQDGRTPEQVADDLAAATAQIKEIRAHLTSLGYSEFKLRQG